MSDPTAAPQPSARPASGRRPGVVTAVAVLCWVVGGLELVLSILVLVLAAVPGALPSTLAGSLFASSIGYLVVALAYLAVGFGVFRGVDVARVIVLLASLIHLAVGLYTALTSEPIAGILSMGLAIAIALPLWIGRGAAWFEIRRRPRT
ncbi:hypothetical protein [uncultured Leifsonia sp.]|uniref:hypothetical protein n=1 Tax=uncultured Leifsonia sp. TaxID=340359 RepID=UPI0025FE786A|nr:hypothetical protein [uncultured Leifsonia sp.]